MARVAVIGGSGFLGSHVADEATRRGHEVVILDLQPSPWAAPDQSVVVGDCRDAATVRAVLEGSDYVYHCAGFADIEASSNRPAETLENNIMGTINVVEGCLAKGVKRLLFASTMYVYSQCGSFYRASKKACEDIIETYAQTKDLKYTVLRYGSLYGERAHGGNTVLSYLSQAVRCGRIVCHGSGDERREFIHVSDAARLSIDALADSCTNESLILTGNQCLSSHELINMIQEIIGRPVNVEFSSAGRSDHYGLTPYRFSPKPGRRMALDRYVEIGQGILSLAESLS